MASRSISRQFPGFDRIYRLSPSLGGNPYWGNLQLEPSEDSRALTWAEYKPPRPIRVEWAQGRSSPGDVIGTTHVIPLLLGPRVHRVLTEGGFSGWTTYPVEVHDRSGTVVEGYVGLAVTGRCGPIDGSRSQALLKQMPGRASTAQRGYYFDPDTWDGSDLFCPTAGKIGGGIFVVLSVRDALLAAKVKNVELERLDEIEYYRS